MTDMEEHDRTLLAERYTWKAGLQKARELLEGCAIRYAEGALAVDLCAGHGHHAIALADLGYRVVSLDASPIRARELEDRARHRSITVAVGGPLDFPLHSDAPARVVTCIGEGLTDLESAAAVRALLARVHERLAPGGVVVLSWRDLSTAVEGLDRFAPVRIDDNAVITRFVEYLPGRAMVHDVGCVRTATGWSLEKRAYPKLRLAPADVEVLLAEVGLTPVRRLSEPMATVVARRGDGAR